MSGATIPLIVLGMIGTPAEAPRAGDAVTLRDGKTIVGEIVETAGKGGTRLIVRREWFRDKLPERYAAWEKNHARDGALARLQRRERIKSWRADRPGDDAVGRWIDAELKRLDAPATGSPLVVVELSRSEVKSVKKGTKPGRAALRLAWETGFKNPEESSEADLKSSLEARGLLVRADDPVDLSPMLPEQPESDVEWLARRAACEVVHDEGLKLIRHGTLVMPEPQPGAPPSPDAVAGALSSTLRELLGDAPAGDPLAPHLKGIAFGKKVGALVTQAEVSADGRSARATCTLWIRLPGGWAAGPWRSSTVNAADLAANEADDVANDPTVSGLFKTVESLGLGGIDPELKRRAVAGGAAARKALGTARSAIQKELERRDPTTGRP